MEGEHSLEEGSTRFLFRTQIWILEILHFCLHLYWVLQLVRQASFTIVSDNGLGLRFLSESLPMPSSCEIEPDFGSVL